VENVTEVLGEVGNWENVAQRNRGDPFGLEISDSKLQEIKQQSYTERDRSHLAAEYWVNTNPRASWLVLSRALYDWGEETALSKVKQYLPKGMWIS